MKKLASLPALRYTAAGLFSLCFAVFMAACAGFIYDITSGFFEKGALPPEGAFDRFAYVMRYGFGAITVSCLTVSVLLIIFIMIGAGSRRRTEGVFPRRIDGMPFELYTFIILGFAALFIVAALETLRAMESWTLFVICPCLLLASFFIQEFFVGLSIRYKTLHFYDNTFTKTVVRKAAYAYENLDLVWKVFAVTIAYFTVTFFTFHYGGYLLLTLWIIASFFVLTIIGFCVVFGSKLTKGAKKIAEGNLNYKIDTTGMLSDFKKFGSELNNISDGITKAVNEKTKSERLRTELITNVSHDIKTPLTSIISYVDLLKRENLTKEQRDEYLEVLERQSAKLKKLIVDLVEASKALTGNISVCLVPANICELLDQASAEYSDRLKSSNLELCVKKPGEPVTVLCDGRLTWRIFDNLLDNICKYSLPGSRVYIDVKKLDDTCAVTFKNISRSVLNISPDELAERFVRGDSSRSTEGSGLGLSIAISLAELQKATLDIEVDGDLFKTTVVYELTQTQL